MSGRRIRRPGHHGSSIGATVRDIQVSVGLPAVEELEDELEEYMDVLLGRTPPPLDAGILTLQEVADVYFARACEIQYLIHKAEREGGVFKGHSYYRFRTGQLRAFLELTKRAAELGSRRLTQARLEFEMANESQGLWLDE